ncbi:MAG: family 10 glycosylhydrolase [Chitinophagaceae bacterium]
MKKTFVLIFYFCLCVHTRTIAQPKYEFRGVWVATVTNIDWPSAGNFNTENQKAEFISLLNMHQRNGLNAVIVQVRPSTDAFYPSPYEPWSEFLTGKQGRPPSPYYDPLAFMIAETHKRGMEFHAWCNPYRAEFNMGKSSISATHITRLHPEWFLVYGSKRYFDPGNKEVQQYVTAVIRDMVKRYDIDAVHFDDYFYPYRIAGEQFPDDSSYAKNSNGLTKEDWRRSNVDSVISFLSRAIKEENKYCKFGVSPFGVWRNSDKDTEGSDTKASQTNYDDLYADILLWLREGWIDYVTPQLYWEFSHKIVGYGTLVDWWSQHAYGRHLYIGHGIYKAYTKGYPAFKNRNELPNQIKKSREYTTVQGSVYYSSKSFTRNPNGWSDSLKNNYYKHPALVPPMNWIDSVKPAKPIVEKQAEGIWKLSAPGEKRIKYFVLYGLLDAERADFEILPCVDSAAVLKENDFPVLCRNGCAVTVVNRNNLESDVEVLK